eukprot:TRINITY_DN3588_c0_g1_i12.p2 TRINITY_DN3588_c0_g1~~TRINITY_DN3588_c0_g1_i12.p2  ORF type:complete len:357 (+),score=71.65 TRINITY_DN3588_c0_g1_i12:1277-2347(+)
MAYVANELDEDIGEEENVVGSYMSSSEHVTVMRRILSQLKQNANDLVKSLQYNVRPFEGRIVNAHNGPSAYGTQFTFKERSPEEYEITFPTDRGEPDQEEYIPLYNRLPAGNQMTTGRLFNIGKDMVSATKSPVFDNVEEYFSKESTKPSSANGSGAPMLMKSEDKKPEKTPVIRDSEKVETRCKVFETEESLRNEGMFRRLSMDNAATRTSVSTSHNGIDALKNKFLQRKADMESRKSLTNDAISVNQESHKSFHIGVIAPDEEGFERRKEVPTSEQVPKAPLSARTPIDDSPMDVSHGAIFATAKLDFNGAGEHDISFTKGTRVQVLKQNSNGMWIGMVDNRIGFFPSSFVEMG